MLLSCGHNCVADDDVQFNRDVRPILADKCFHCHGPDAATREAELRLDDAENTLAPRDGYEIVASGSPLDSELYRRVVSGDETEQMPPADQERQLNSAEIDTLRRWIEQGAEYESHWAFLPPERPPIPEIESEHPPRNAIDHFVLSRLEGEGIAASPPADMTTLIRRVTLSLTGLPPTPEEVDRFLKDDAPDAYERLVDRLLASPRYGERMGLGWLDAARYADSGGYQGDILRVMWPWRDWVIAAYNAGMPFDQFTTEQLAGDLLTDPTREQLIATGFNRNHRINDEDGIILEEFRVEYVADRVETTAAVWMGLTIGCARCHDHKYDPISQQDYYRLFAYFNSVDEQGRGHGNAPPLLQLPTQGQTARIAELDAELEMLRADSEESDDTASGDSGSDAVAARIKELEEQRDAVNKSIVTTMVMRELAEPRDTHVLIRGGYDRPGALVRQGIPASLSARPDDAPLNRLALAEWLVGDSHPLTARVAVNRYWQMYFGRGLVATPEDFGTQGALPSHPALLDWLANEFVRTGWDVKSMQRLIVTSATFRQSSAGSPELTARDPQNRLLARGPRFRLPAESLRDQALFASGLLVERLGGPSVRPYQPSGLWTELASASQDYVQDQGENLYRRSLYTFIRRTIPPPGMTVLDAPNREICTVRRARTNTPTQALALMNETVYIESGRQLAERALSTDHESAERQLTRMFQRVLARQPTDEELVVIIDLYEEYHARFNRDVEAAEQLLSIGESPRDTSLDVAQHAALTAVANLLLNLDETLTLE